MSGRQGWLLAAVAASACTAALPIGTNRPEGKPPPPPERRIRFDDTAQVRMLRNGMIVVVAPIPGAALAAHGLPYTYYQDEARAIASTVLSDLVAWSPARARPALVHATGHRDVLRNHLRALQELWSQ